MGSGTHKSFVFEQMHSSCLATEQKIKPKSFWSETQQVNQVIIWQQNIKPVVMRKQSATVFTLLKKGISSHLFPGQLVCFISENILIGDTIEAAVGVSLTLLHISSLHRWWIKWA